MGLLTDGAVNLGWSWGCRATWRAVAADVPGTVAATELGNREGPGAVAAGRAGGTGAGGVKPGRGLAATPGKWGRALGKREAAAAAPTGATGRSEGNWTGAGGAAGEGAAAEPVPVPVPVPKAKGAEPRPRLRGPASRPKPDASIGAAWRSEH